jgi:molybdenum cofactor biosynthesis enzyme MoaA
VIERLQTEYAMLPMEAFAPGETAQRWAYADAQGKPDAHAGEIGVISSVTQAFCGDCNRARLSTEGQLYLCLFASRGYDLRTLLRSGASAHDVARNAARKHCGSAGAAGGNELYRRIKCVPVYEIAGRHRRRLAGL